jgi:hypothetical protein
MKAGAGRALRALAHVASSHPWLARVAMRAFGAFPTLKLRVRRLLLQPEAASAGALNDAQVRVLLDLRESAASRGSGKR